MATNFIKQTADHVIVVSCSADLQELPCILPFEVGACWMVEYTKAPLAWWSVHTDWIRDSRGLEKHVLWANDWVKG